MDPIDPWVDADEVRKLAQSLLMPIAREPDSQGEACFGDGFVGFADSDAPANRRMPAADPPPAQAPPQAEAMNPPETESLRQIQDQARESLAHARERAEQGGLLDRPAVSAPPPPASPAPVAPPEAEPPEAAPPEAVPPTTPPPEPTVTPAPDPPVASPPPPVTTQAPFVERLHAYGQWLRTAVEAKAFFVTDRDGHVLMDEVRAPRLLQVARTLAQASHAANRHAGGGAVGSLHVKLGESSILEVLPVETSYGPLILGIVVPNVLTSAAIPVISSGLEQVVDGRAR